MEGCKFLNRSEFNAFISCISRKLSPYRYQTVTLCPSQRSVVTSDGQRMPIYRQTVDKFGLIDTREKRTQTLFLLQMGQIFRAQQ